MLHWKTSATDIGLANTLNLEVVTDASMFVVSPLILYFFENSSLI